MDPMFFSDSLSIEIKKLYKKEKIKTWSVIHMNYRDTRTRFFFSFFKVKIELIFALSIYCWPLKFMLHMWNLHYKKKILRYANAGFSMHSWKNAEIAKPKTSLNKNVVQQVFHTQIKFKRCNQIKSFWHTSCTKNKRLTADVWYFKKSNCKLSML